MGQVTDELAIQLLVFKNFFLADNLHLLILLMKFEDQSLSFGRCRLTGSVNYGGGGGLEGQFVFAEACIVFDNLIQHRK